MKRPHSNQTLPLLASVFNSFDGFFLMVDQLDSASLAVLYSNGVCSSLKHQKRWRGRDINRSYRVAKCHGYIRQIRDILQIWDHTSHLVLLVVAIHPIHLQFRRVASIAINSIHLSDDLRIYSQLFDFGSFCFSDGIIERNLHNYGHCPQ